jgi:hypothetical protein
MGSQDDKQQLVEAAQMGKQAILDWDCGRLEALWCRKALGVIGPGGSSSQPLTRRLCAQPASVVSFWLFPEASLGKPAKASGDSLQLHPPQLLHPTPNTVSHPSKSPAKGLPAHLQRGLSFGRSMEYRVNHVLSLRSPCCEPSLNEIEKVRTQKLSPLRLQFVPMGAVITIAKRLAHPDSVGSMFL